MAAVHIFQILNHYTRREELDPGFGVLDNSANLRPDWYEYWPIRNFLVNEQLDPDAYYGFFSPKFRIKTNLSAEDVSRFIAAAPADTDVFLFSPSIHKSAYFLNVFVHGDAEHPGLFGVSEKFFARLGYPDALKDLISDSRNTVHSNFFVAKPHFWRAWLEITEKMYAIAEDANDELGRELSAPTNYRGGQNVHMKIFLMERVATWLLITRPSIKSRMHDPFAARNRFYKLPLALICDALKIAYTSERRGQYKDVFGLVRAMSGFWTWQIRLGGLLRFSAVGLALSRLASYWERKP